VIWSTVKADASGKKRLYALFWSKGKKALQDLLTANQIDHILIKKSRIYDDFEEHRSGGYPKSFVERLAQLEGWVNIFDNSGVVLWKMVHR
jgi:hypothetical protein